VRSKVLALTFFSGRTEGAKNLDSESDTGDKIRFAGGMWPYNSVPLTLTNSQLGAVR
jgi:hypothetical protein